MDSVMEKAVKTLRQLLNLGIFWVAVCASLAGMLTYTKAGLEAVFADLALQQASRAPKPAAAQPTPAPAAPTQVAPVQLAPAAAAAAARPAPQAAAQPAAQPADLPAPVAGPQLVTPPKRAQRTL